MTGVGMTGVGMTGAGMSAPLACCFLGGWGSTTELWHATLTAANAEVPTQSALSRPHFLSWLHCLQDWPAALATLSALPGQCLLIGWSLGALLALRAALDLPTNAMPEKIAALVLISGTPCMCASQDYGGIDPRVLATMRIRVSRNPGAVLEEFAQQCAAPDGDALTHDSYLQQARQFSAAELAAGLDTLATLDLRSRLAEIRVPCRLLHGACDRIVPLPSAQFLAAQLPNAQLEVLVGRGHALPFTAPERIARTIASVLA